MGFPDFGVVVLTSGPRGLVGIDDPLVERTSVPFVKVELVSSYCSSIVSFPSDASVLLLLIGSSDNNCSTEFEFFWNFNFDFQNKKEI